MMALVEQLGSLAIACAETPLWSLPDSDVVSTLDEVHRAEQALAAAKLHLVREADSRDLARADHAYTCAAWLRIRLRVSPAAARGQVELARALDSRPVLDAALAAGAVNIQQAQVIDEVLSALPAEAGVAAAEKAEAMLIAWATDFDAPGLRMLGARILEHVAPEVAERRDRAALERAEARAFAGRTLSLFAGSDGRTRVQGWLDTEAAAIVNAALDPLCAPRHAADTIRPQPGEAADHVVADDRTMGQRRADALVEVCRLVLNTGDLPANGGDRPQVTVTVPLDVLCRQLDTGTLAAETTESGLSSSGPSRSGPSRSGQSSSGQSSSGPSGFGMLGIGTLDTGRRLTPGQVRRLACDAQIMPAILGSEGQVLDVGRSRRLITGSLRRALALRDRGCAFPTCTRPPRWTDGHHIKSWVDGGPTSLDNAVLLCGPHHRTIHHTDWQVRLGPDQLPEFIPPAHLDLQQRPRRNTYHRRT
ncbi:MAG TPA: DUF222 domain-containing protein [Actinoplanes sp.]|nr:DUF222 domain-containing protein [Actinoplanes sp.]